ncbi:MAG TPA: copper homeostasis protein CutC [Bacteroidia bacterium]|nr:copper homeostasis protein CutC [Bacteroidia bacterium]
MNRILEIACFNLASARMAQTAGANRIEFCKDYQHGGLSPDFTDIERARSILNIPLHVIIRPRKGNFVYTIAEKEKMLECIAECGKIGVDGVVIGALNESSEIDEKTCLMLKREAGQMRICFHRALDESIDPEKAIETLVRLGFDKVLSSGASATAEAGANRLALWQKKFKDHITIMPGGGIRSGNLSSLLRITACSEFHSAAITGSQDKPDTFEIERMRKILDEV